MKIFNFKHAPPLPFDKISFGPETQSLEIINFFNIIDSSKIFGSPSCKDVKITKSDCFIYGYGLDL